MRSLLLAGFLLVMSVAPASAQTADVVGAIYAAAQNHNVQAQPLIDLARCETGGTFDTHTKGDYRWRDGRYVPTSRGPFQINDLETGLYWHFRALGYDDQEDAQSAADYAARVLSGEFASRGITMRRWMCWRL